LQHCSPYFRHDDRKSSEFEHSRGDFVEGIGIKQEQTMRPRSTLTLAALVLGAACASVPALAQSRQSSPSYSNTGPYNGAPLSPNGISAAANSYGGPGPGFVGPSGGKGTPGTYSNNMASGSPVSPNGISAAASAYGGPGPAYIGPAGGKGAPAPYSNNRATGAPISPNGISAAANAYGGPGYMGN
jgi:hypothetical protein